MPVPGVTNSFAVDYNTGEHLTDINNPPKKPYVFQSYPRTVYHHESGRVETVQNEQELNAMAKRGFKTAPSPKHDYSNLKGNIAQLKAVVKPREEELTPAQIAALEEK